MTGLGVFRPPVWYVALDVLSVALLLAAAFLWSQGVSAMIWVPVGAAGLVITTYTGVRFFFVLKGRLQDGE